MNRFGYWAISNSASGGCGSLFFKMDTAVTAEECRSTVKDYLLIKVQQWSNK